MEKTITLSVEDLKCLQEHLRPLSQLLSKLKKGAEHSAPILKKKPETKKEGLSRMAKMIEQRESRKLSK